MLTVLAPNDQPYLGRGSTAERNRRAWLGFRGRLTCITVLQPLDRTKYINVKYMIPSSIGSLDMPRTFFKEFVEAAVQDWRDAPGSKVRAINAITQADVMAERMFNYLKANSPALRGKAIKISEYRRDLRTRWPSLGIAWDAHDTHKHGILGSHKTVRLITRGQGPELIARSGAIGEAPIGALPIGGYRLEMILELDDGTIRRLDDILTDALSAWEAELQTIGL
jgi:hypothetical protein